MGKDDGWNQTIGSGSGCFEVVAIAFLALMVPAFFAMGFVLMSWL